MGMRFDEHAFSGEAKRFLPRVTGEDQNEVGPDGGTRDPAKIFQERSEIKGGANSTRCIAQYPLKAVRLPVDVAIQPLLDAAF
jgi:hypothetical protein